jgi:hypothetical protein
MKKIINILGKYKGLILLVLTFIVMLNMYIARIGQLRQIEQNQVNITEKR